MANHAIIVLGFLLLNTHFQVRADFGEVHEITKKGNSPTLNNKPYGVAEESNYGQREKRFYNFFDYHFGLNFNPEIPTLVKRDQSFQTGNYDSEYPMNLIFQKIQEITNIAKHRTYLPPPPQIPRPTFIPFLYIPKTECQCSNNNKQSTTSHPMPSDQVSPNKDDANVNKADVTNNKTVPEFPTRFPEIDNESRDGEINGDDYGDDSDGTRPISLKKPIKSNSSSTRVSPPLEHGSSQAGTKPHIADALPPALAPELDSVSPSENISLCESAAIFCCHKPQVTYECFTAQSCVNPVELVEPCEPEALLKTINKLQHLYNSKKTSSGR